MKYLIGTDIGTSGTKTIIMNIKGELLASTYMEYGLMTPRALWAEQWPDVWVDAVKQTIREAVRKMGGSKDDIAGICISGLYGGSGIPCDKDMLPVRPCIIWMDRRAQQQTARVQDTIGADRLYDLTKNGTDPYYGYTKMLWIRDNEPENWQKIKMFLPPNAYAIYQLTGEAAIDYTSAGNIGGIFDTDNRCWAEDMMQEMGIPVSYMPQRIVASSDIVGYITPAAAEELGLAVGTPVCAGGVDCVVATLGLGVFEPGQYVATIGTSMTCGFVHQRTLAKNNLICMPYVIEPKTTLFTFGGAATAGALPRWFRDEFAKDLLGKDEPAYTALESEAKGIPCGSEGVIVLPYFMGERAPIWNVDARGTVFGLALHHTRAHVYRAFLEAVAYSLRDSLENINAGIDLDKRLILAGGVVKSPLWKQIFADVTGYRIVTPDKDVEANLGDVFLAGVGTGTLEYEALRSWVRFGDEIMPDPKRHAIYTKYFEQYKRLYENTKYNMQDIAELAKSEI
jgi:xylulokinase